MRNTRVLLILGLGNLLLGVYYLFVGLRISTLYSKFNVESPNIIFGNVFFLTFSLFAILSFIFWYLVKGRLSKGLGVNKMAYNAILLILSAPLTYLLISQIYSLLVINILLN